MTRPSATSRATPPGWGDDELSKFLQATHEQQYATFYRKRTETARLIAVDKFFVRISDGWINPKSQLVAMLSLRCHAALRAAAGEAMAGQAVECYRQCRGMMENAAYAVHVHRDPSLEKIWLNRHTGVEGMRASKRAFQHTSVIDSVIAANRHAGERFQKLYQRTIDLGGHPNERSVTGSMKIEKNDERHLMLAIMLHGDGTALDAALKSVAQCAAVSLEMLQVPLNARFELLGINADLLEFRRSL